MPLLRLTTIDEPGCETHRPLKPVVSNACWRRTSARILKKYHSDETAFHKRLHICTCAGEFITLRTIFTGSPRNDCLRVDRCTASAGSIDQGRCEEMSFLKPVTTHDLEGTVTMQVRFSGDDVTINLVGFTPSSAATETVAWLSPGRGGSRLGRRRLG